MQHLNHNSFPHILLVIIADFLTKSNHLSILGVFRRRRIQSIIPMRRSRITITLQRSVLNKIDGLIDGETIRNRSHAIEYILNKHLQNGVKKAVILAGGKGSKLRPFTYEIPKSLIPIKGKPLLEYTIESLKNNNSDEIIVCTGYLGEQIKKHFGDGKKFGVHMEYSDDTSPRQTGGALLKAKKFLSHESFLVIHGDILTNFQYQDILQFHMEHKPIITAAMVAVEHPEEFGQMQLHGIQLVHFFNKNKSASVKSHLINCGIYVCSPEIFDYLPKDRKSFLFEDIIETLILEKKVNGYVFEQQWFDVGSTANYEKAIKEYKEE